MKTSLTTIEWWNTLNGKAENGDSDAQFELYINFENGVELEEGKIINQDIQKAKHWLLESFNNQNLDAFVTYGDLLTEGIYFKKDIALGISIYEKAIQKGSGAAAMNLGLTYARLAKHDDAFEHYKIARELGYEDCLRIGLCFLFGIGTDKDLKESNACFESVLEKPKLYAPIELDQANYYLGLIQLLGNNSDRFAKASTYFRKANFDNDNWQASEILDLIKT